MLLEELDMSISEAWTKSVLRAARLHLPTQGTDLNLVPVTLPKECVVVDFLPSLGELLGEPAKVLKAGKAIGRVSYAKVEPYGLPDPWVPVILHPPKVTRKMRRHYRKYVELMGLIQSGQLVRGNWVRWRAQAMKSAEVICQEASKWGMYGKELAYLQYLLRYFIDNPGAQAYGP